MPLLELWRSSPDSIKSYAIRQVVAIAGDGRLRDASMCAAELRAYLRETTSEKLAAYATQCLHEAFEESGLVLQDVINEIGRRLEFKVEDGRYRGAQGTIGFDGIWRVGTDINIIVEVKTTDTYNVRLDKIAQYKDLLVRSGRVPSDTSTLFVVGRKDTGALEAQIRGSRYAWDMRVVGVESLVKLMSVKEKSTEDATVRQIRELLRPFEYTRVDKIVDVVFDTAADVEQSAEETLIEAVSEKSPKDDEIQTQQRTQPDAIDAMRERIVGTLQRKFNCQFIKRRRALFESPDGKTRVCVSLSKHYDREYQPYWYAYHPAWHEFLTGAKEAFVVLGCMDKNEAFAIPLSVFTALLPKLNQTNRGGGKSYWHIVLAPLENGELALYSSRTGDKIGVKEYAITL